MLRLLLFSLVCFAPNFPRTLGHDLQIYYNEWSTELDIVLSLDNQIPQFLPEIILKDSNLPIFQVKASFNQPTCSKCSTSEPNPSVLVPKDSCLKITLPFCPLASPLAESSQIQIKAKVSLWNVSAIRVALEANGLQFVFSESPENVQALYKELLVFPKSIKEGTSFYAGYNAGLHSFGRGFHQNDPLYKTRIFTFPKAGTHIFSGTLAGMLNEHVGLFPEAQRQPAKTDESVNELRASPFHTRFLASHNIPSTKRKPFLVRKVVLSFRNPIDAIDSKFHSKNQLATPKCKNAKSLSGYENEKLFENIIRQRTVADTALFNQAWDISQKLIRYHVRFEDMTQKPIETFKELISYVNSFPFEWSHLGRVEEFLETKGIVSNYKTIKVKGEQEEEGKPKNEFGARRDLLRAYPRHNVEKIFKSFEQFIYFYGYAEKYREVLGETIVPIKKEIENETEFAKENKRVLEKLLRYELNDKEALENMEMPPQNYVPDWRETIETETNAMVAKYRNFNC